MLDLRQCKTVSILGGGTAGWFAALSLKQLFGDAVEVQVLESPNIGVVGVGEGGLINLVQALNRLQIPTSDFMRATDATFKWGFCYEGWRNGEQQDEFYHLFVNPTLTPFNYHRQDYYPLVADVVANQQLLAHAVKDFQAITQRVSQQAATNVLSDHTGVATSFHFDSYKVAEFLSQVAHRRGVVHIQTEIKDIEFDHQGYVTSLIGEQGRYATDFLIDASGLSRVVIQKKLNSRWISFKDYLWLDKAIPFHIAHRHPNPELVSRATAMQAGWMWQIPLRSRIGAGYVFSSEFISEQQAVDEIQRYFSVQIEPQRTINFEPGHFAEVWQKNIMSIGLSSGFVEPLEATSIGQMLEQLRMFDGVVRNSGLLVSDLTIQQFNQANTEMWAGIRDFLRMHYDCTRKDTPFWQKVADTPYPPSYAALKQVFAQRLPRTQDIKGYAQHGWAGIFHVINWIFVAQGLGLISAECCQQELNALPKEISTELRLRI